MQVCHRKLSHQRGEVGRVGKDLGKNFDPGVGQAGNHDTLSGNPSNEWGPKWRELCRFQRHLGTNLLQRIDSRGGATGLSISFCYSTSSPSPSGACLPTVCRYLFAGSWCDRIFFGPVSSKPGTCSLPRQNAPTATSKRGWFTLTERLIIGNSPGWTG